MMTVLMVPLFAQACADASTMKRRASRSSIRTGPTDSGLPDVLAEAANAKE
jgi:hypothetical protein